MTDMIRAKALLESIFTQLARSSFSTVDWKADGSPVSNLDLAVHSRVKEIVGLEFPGHVLVSEEQQNPIFFDPEGSYVFLDPIDGTENFISGIPIWASGISVFTAGIHVYSAIVSPPLGIRMESGQKAKQDFSSRVVGFSSSARPSQIPDDISEFRVLGSAMVNFALAIQGSFAKFENTSGSHCWDILPGLNLARAAGLTVEVDGAPYLGAPLFPTQKYSFSVRGTS